MSESSRDQQVQAILHSYLQAVDAGQAPDREEILRAHPGIADELRAFFADQAKMDGLAESLHRGHALAGDITLGVDEVAATNSVPLTLKYFGDYELQAEIARGGMGVVFKARQVSLNRPVALKMILKGELANEADVQRFRDEAEAAANLDHPNIVPIYEIGEHQGQQYFSMKLIGPGKRRADLGVKETVRITALVARAVHHAHQRGILHRDLKPGNILFDENGEPHVADFGLAKRVGTDSGATRSGAIVGTPSYMAPEQARAEKVLTTAVDVYSLGAILYEWLTGQPPFRGDDVLATLTMVANAEPASPRSLNPQIDRDLETICLKCLEKEPAKRFATADALAEELDRYLAGEPILARPNTTWERSVKWARRRPALAGLLAVSGLSAVVLLVVGAVMWRDAEMRAETVRDLTIAQGQVAEQQALVGIKRAEVEKLEQLAKDEQGAADKARKTARHILYAADMQFAHAAWEKNNLAQVVTLLERHNAAEDDLRGFEWHYLRRLLEGDRFTLRAPARPVTDFVLAATPIALSPDGKTLAAAIVETKSKTAASTIKLWDVNTGKVKGGFPVSEMILALALDADGQALYGTIMDRDALKNINATAKLDRKRDMLVMTGEAKPSLYKLLQMLQVQKLSLDGRKLGAPMKLELDRFGTAGAVRIMAYGQVFLKGQVFQPTCAAVSADRTALAGGGIAVAVNLRNPAAVSDPENALLLWDIAKEEPQIVLKGFDGAVMAVALAPDGKTLAAGIGRSVKLYDVPSGKQRATWTGHTATVGAVAFSRDGKMLASGSFDGAIKVWDVAAGQELTTHRGHRTRISDLRFTPDDKTLASVSMDGVIKLWDPKAPQGPARLKLDNRVILRLAFEPDHATLNVGTARAITQWNVVTGAQKSFGTGLPVPPIQAELAPDGKVLATTSFDDKIVLRDALTTKELRTLKVNGRARHMTFSPDGRLFAAASDGKMVKLWDTATGVEQHTLSVDSVCLAFAPDGKTLATATMENNIMLWDVACGQQRGALPKRAQRSVAIAFSADSARLASANGDSVIIWDLAAGREAVVIDSPGQTFHALAFSPNGKRLATVGTRAGVPAVVKLWDTSTGLEVLSLDLPDARGSFLGCRLAFSQDGRRLAVSEQILDILRSHAEVRVWDATSTPRPADASTDPKR